jgi:hypothetical protein
MAEKPKRVSEMTKEEREAFKKNIRKPKDVKINRITVSSPGGDPTNRNKDGSIKRTKQIRKEFSTKEGVLPKKKIITEKKDSTAKPAKTKPKKVSTRGNPLKDRPRSIAEAKRRGEVYFYDSKGVKKIAATAADLKRTGLTLRQYANKFAPKKQTKKDAEALKPYALKKRGGGMMKKKGMARGGMMMKKKGMAKGGKLKMVMKDGKKVPFFAADGKGKMRGGGMMMKKKGYAMGGAMKKKGMAKGGAMKKKGYKKGGKVLKMRGGGLATRGTSFTIK